MSFPDEAVRVAAPAGHAGSQRKSWPPEPSRLWFYAPEENHSKTDSL